jgi:hypothetical protein
MGTRVDIYYASDDFVDIMLLNVNDNAVRLTFLRYIVFLEIQLVGRHVGER